MPQLPLTSVVKVLDNQLEKFQNEVAKLNAKAIKFGQGQITLKKRRVGEYTVRWEDASRDGSVRASYLVPRENKDRNYGAVVKVWSITIEHPIIKLGNWAVVGSLMALGVENLLFNLSADPRDIAAVERYSLSKLECQHCNQKRTRHSSYILRSSETGQHICVGKNCLKDFTGINPADALAMAKMYELVFSDWTDKEDFAKASYTVPVAFYLASVLHVSREHGFVTRKESKTSGAWATADQARAFISEPDCIALCEPHMRKARKIIEWSKTLPNILGYNSNIKLILKQDCISMEHKMLALAASSVLAYDRAISNASADAQQVPSQFVGAVGDKLTMELQILRIIHFETEFGVKSLVIMKDGSGNRFKWMASRLPQVFDESEGKQMLCKFTIKEHSEYNTQNQTVATRLKFLNWVAIETKI